MTSRTCLAKNTHKHTVKCGNIEYLRMNFFDEIDYFSHIVLVYIEQNDNSFKNPFPWQIYKCCSQMKLVINLI